MAFHQKDKTNTGAPGPTPAPTRTAFPDAASKIRAPTGQGYGTNGPVNPSSVDPGQTLESDASRSIREAQDDGEHVLDQVQAHGSKIPNQQTRDVPMTGLVAPSHGMTRQTKTDASGAVVYGGVVPAKCGWNDGTEDKKPG